MDYTTSEQRRIREHMDSFARAYGYEDWESVPADLTPEDVIRAKVDKPASLLDLAWSGDWLCDERVGRALEAAKDHDGQHCGDLLRDVIKPLIDAEVEKQAKHWGVGEHFDPMAVAA